jgi:hypothetical protein
MIRIRLLCLALPLLAACSSAPLLETLPLDAPARIDGLTGEWAGKIQYVEKAGLSVGAHLGTDAIDLVIVTADPGLQMQILNLGLTIWLDGAGGKEQEFGLRYPAPELGGGIPPGRQAGDRREGLELLLGGLGGDFLLLDNKDDDGRLMMAGGHSGFDLAMGLEGPRLVYELRIPLVTGERNARALELESGLLGLGLKVKAPERENLEAQTSSMASSMGKGSGGPGRRGGAGGGTGDLGGGPRAAQPNWLDTWVKLQLN